jgi:hypothetical protein
VAQVHAALQNIPGENIVGVLTNALQNAFNLFGQIRLAQLPVIPVSHIRNINPELLWNAGFDTAASISTGSGYTWDGTVGHTALGSAKCIPDGVTTFPLLSSPVPVTQGENLTVSVYTEWSALTHSGSNPIQLLVQTYLNGSPVGTTTIASEATPGASSSWTQLTGSYPVPAGVDTVFVMPVVNPTATGGTVWFDDASVTKAGVLAAGTGLVDSFESALTALWGSNAIGPVVVDAQNLADTIMQAITNDTSSIGNSFSNVSTHLSSAIAAFLGWTQAGIAPGGTVGALAQTAQEFANRSATSKQLHGAIDPSGDPVFSIAQTSGASAPTIGVTSAASAIGFISIPAAGVKQSVCWYGGATTNITSFVLNFYSVNTATGAMTYLFNSGNIVGSVANPGSGVALNYYDFPDTQTLTLNGTSNNFSVNYGGRTSANTSYNASAATVQSSLVAAFPGFSGNVSVSGPNGGPYVVTFSGPLAFTSQTLGINQSGGTPSVTVAYLYAAQGTSYAVELAVQGSGTYNMVGLTHWQSGVPNTNVFPSALGASRAAVAPTLGVVGPGSSITTSSPTTMSWTHTPNAADNYVAVGHNFYAGGATITISSVTYGATAMNLRTSQSHANVATNGVTYFYDLPITPGAGAKTVTITYSAAPKSASGVSLSYQNASHGSGAVVANGTSTAPTLSITGSANQMLVNAIGYASAGSSPTQSAYSKTQEYNNAASDSGSTSWSTLLVGQTAGTGSASVFSDTGPNQPWADIAYVLNGAVTAGANISAATVATLYSTNVPWFALCGVAGMTQYPPVLVPYTTHGSYSFTPSTTYTWATYADIVICGGGGGGGSGGNITYTGQPGSPSVWSAATIALSSLTGALSITVGAGGAGGPYSSGSPHNGTAGTSSSVNGTGITTVTSAGGALGLCQNFNGESLAYATSSGPGNETFNGNIYYGGAGSSTFGVAGGDPGAGGAGGIPPADFGIISGGNGADGAVYILLYT